MYVVRRRLARRSDSRTRGQVNRIGQVAVLTYVGRVSRPIRTRAAFGAALVGMLLALVTTLTGAAPQPAPVERAPSSAPSLEGSTSQLGHAVLRTSHASVGSALGVDRAGGHGASASAAGALLLLALVCLAVGVRRVRTLRQSALIGARACRAPPAAVLA